MTTWHCYWSIRKWNLSFKKSHFFLRCLSYKRKKKFPDTEKSMKYLMPKRHTVLRTGANSKRMWCLIDGNSLFSFTFYPDLSSRWRIFSLLSVQFSGSLLLVSLHYANPHLAECAACWTTCWNNQKPSVFQCLSLFIFLSIESLQCHFRPQILPVTRSLPSHPSLSCINVIRMTVSSLKMWCLVLFKRDLFTKFLLLWRGDKFGFNLGMDKLKIVSTAHLQKIAQV